MHHFMYQTAGDFDTDDCILTSSMRSHDIKHLGMMTWCIVRSEAQSGYGDKSVHAA